MEYKIVFRLRITCRYTNTQVRNKNNFRQYIMIWEV